ncbi:MAG: SOS response-associated peptidase family protein [Bacteroidota bacterium]|nr:SOS response-associated peptidase family protein [Bacteroidota bacterium]
MCYYNGIRVTHGEYLRLKDLEKLFAPIHMPLVQGPMYAPDVRYPVLRATAEKSDFEIVPMDWGFLPEESKWPFLKDREQVDRWRKGYKDAAGWHKGYTTLNATCENLLINEKGNTSLYASAARARRILIPSTGFFEWRHLPELGKKGQPLKSTLKIPHFIYLPEHVAVGKPFYMAGIYNTWVDDSTGESVDTFAILTTVANHLMQQIHNSKNRMPTILEEDLAYEWLFGNLSDARILEIAATQFPARRMWAHTVEKKFIEAVDPTIPYDYKDSRLILEKEVA